MSVPSIRVAIADDHDIFRAALKVFLTAKKRIQIVWEAADGKALLEQWQTSQPDVLLLYQFK